MTNHPLWTVAKKEFMDAWKESLFLTLAIFLFLLTGTSLLVASFAFQSQIAQYATAFAQLTHMGLQGAALSRPEYFPLQMLRGTIEYLEIVGAIIGIILGFLSINKEKGNRTTELLFSRPIPKTTIIGGKVIGSSLLILSILCLIVICIVVSISGLGHVGFNQTELLKLGIGFSFSYMYLMVFYCLSAILTIIVENSPHALIISFVVWILIVLIIPQVGDTMDPDNQVPGGFFASMHMTKPQENQVIAKFKTYETLRNTLEESSVEKHYERAVFATLGIKDIYNNKSLMYIFHDQWGNILWLGGYFITGLIATIYVWNRFSSYSHS